LQFIGSGFSLLDLLKAKFFHAALIHLRGKFFKCKYGKKIKIGVKNKYNDYKYYKSYNDYMNSFQSGGYKSLPFYIQSEIIYDFTVKFCDIYIDKRSRIHDQMVQAARSGKQNIAEGYLQKSIEGKLKLLGVARGSLEELLNDYQDFLRQKGLTLWKVDSVQARKIRALAYKSYKDYNDYKIYISNPESAANCMVCLINQTNRLLDQKLRWLEEKFVKEGGFRENLFKKRREYTEKGI